MSDKRYDPATLETLDAADFRLPLRSAVYRMLAEGNYAAVLAIVGALRDDASDAFTRRDNAPNEALRRYWNTKRHDTLALVYDLESAEKIAIHKLEEERA